MKETTALHIAKAVYFTGTVIGSSLIGYAGGIAGCLAYEAALIGVAEYRIRRYCNEESARTKK